MGQVAKEPSKGLKPLGRIGLSDSDRGIGLPKRDREDKPRPGTTVVDKKKDKSKAAAAGGGKNPPKNPPTRGPKGPNWPNKDNDKKEPAKETKKKPPEGGLGALVKNRK
jgi:hypothetical protein